MEIEIFNRVRLATITNFRLASPCVTRACRLEWRFFRHHNTVLARVQLDLSANRPKHRGGHNFARICSHPRLKLETECFCAIHPHQQLFRAENCDRFEIRLLFWSYGYFKQRNPRPPMFPSLSDYCFRQYRTVFFRTYVVFHTSEEEFCDRVMRAATRVDRYAMHDILE